MNSRASIIVRTLLISLLSGISIAHAAGFPKSKNNEQFPENIYVALQNANAVEVLPEEKVWPGFPQAHYIAIGPEGKTIVVGGFATGNVYIADALTGKKRATLKVSQVVQGVKITPDGRFAYAVDATGGTVKVIDLGTLKVTRTIPVGKNPHNLIFSADGRRAYVTLQGGNKLAVVDAKSFQKIAEFDNLGLQSPHNIDLNRKNGRLWIRNHPDDPDKDGKVAAVDVRERRAFKDLTVGKFHGGIDQIEGSDVLTTDIGGDTVEVIDPDKISVIKRIKVGEGPHGVRLSLDGRWAYVSATRANEVDIIDMHTLTVVNRIKTSGEFPFWIAVKGNP